MAHTLHGRCICFDVKQGFGFILEDQGGHIFATEGNINVHGFKVLKQNQECWYRVSHENGIRKASHIVPIKTAAQLHGRSVLHRSRSSLV
jgi:cold shock CspA family protein